MNKFKKELEELIDRDPFVPFVVTSNDGFAMAVPSPKRALVGRAMLVVTDEHGFLRHFPFGGIAHISEATGNL